MFLNFSKIVFNFTLLIFKHIKLYNQKHAQHSINILLFDFIILKNYHSPFLSCSIFWKLGLFNEVYLLIIAFVLNLRIFPIICMHISIILYYLFSEIIVKEGSEFLVSCNKFYFFELVYRHNLIQYMIHSATWAMDEVHGY